MLGMTSWYLEVPGVKGERRRDVRGPSVEDVKRLGRATQGVIVMRLRGDERVSALAPVVDSDDEAVPESEPAAIDTPDDDELLEPDVDELDSED